MVKTVNFVMCVLLWLKIILFKKEEAAEVPAHLMDPACHCSERGRSDPQCLPAAGRSSLSPPSSLISNSRGFIIKELPEMECESGAQLDVVSSCFPVRCCLSGAWRECAESRCDLSPSKGGGSFHAGGWVWSILAPVQKMLFPGNNYCVLSNWPKRQTTENPHSYALLISFLI